MDEQFHSLESVPISSRSQSTMTENQKIEYKRDVRIRQRHKWTDKQASESKQEPQPTADKVGTGRCHLSLNYTLFPGLKSTMLSTMVEPGSDSSQMRAQCLAWIVLYRLRR
ncbi:hypothetical protein CEXT_205551, partial [Caerostris extrusa]